MCVCVCVCVCVFPRPSSATQRQTKHTGGLSIVFASVLHPQRATSQGAVRCEQCLSVTSSAGILKRVPILTSQGVRQPSRARNFADSAR